MGKKEWSDAVGDLVLTRSLRRQGFRKLNLRAEYIMVWQVKSVQE